MKHNWFVIALSIAILTFLNQECFAQDAWPEYDGTGTDRGPGWYFAWYKFLLVIPLFLGWVKAADWINRDVQIIGEKTKMPVDVWNPIVVFSFFVGFLCVITVPYFAIGYLFYLAGVFGPFLTYVLQRNAAVSPEEKVFTAGHIKNRMAGNKATVVEFSNLPQDEGAPVEFSAAGPDHATQQTNLISVRQNPAFSLIKDLVYDAVARRAESVRMDFARQGVAVRYQIDGVWHNMEPRDRESGDAMLVGLKQLANLDPADRRSKQEADFKFTLPERKMACTIRSQGVKTGETVQLIFSQQKKTSWTLSELGMLPDMYQELREYLNSPGYVLVSALPGDGLSTSWEGVLNSMDRVMRDVVGVCDINNKENKFENIEFTTFNKSAGEAPDQVVKKLFLKLPEAVVVPDPCNGTSIDILVDYSETQGATILSHMRSKSAEEAIVRMLALKPDRSNFVKSLNVVLFQRLVRRLCDHCKTQFHPPPQLLKKLRIDPRTKPVFYKHWQPPPPEELVDEKGRPIEAPICQVCSGLGYIGRIAVYELFVINDEIRKVIVNDPRVEMIRNVANQNGQTPLTDNGLKLVLAGVTSLSELQRVFKS